jgi:hypothetical protein
VGVITTDDTKSDAELTAMAKNWTIVGKDLLRVVSCTEPYEWKDPTDEEWEFNNATKQQQKKFLVGGPVPVLQGQGGGPNRHAGAYPVLHEREQQKDRCRMLSSSGTALEAVISCTHVWQRLRTPMFTMLCVLCVHTLLYPTPSLELTLCCCCCCCVRRWWPMTLASSTTSCAAWPPLAARSWWCRQTTPRTRCWHSTPTASSSAMGR